VRSPAFVTGFLLAQNRDDLLFRDALTLHLSVLLSRPNSSSRGKKNKGQVIDTGFGQNVYSVLNAIGS
jgi:hypothetical protein